MTDFFTKKQKKYWCDKCHIFIEYTKSSIEKHNQSKNHINNSFSGSRYDNMKKKFNNYVNNLKLSNEPKETFLKNKTQREAYFESSNYFEEIKNESIKSKIEKSNIINETEKEDNNNNTSSRKWGVFWDETYKLPYYFNFVTGDSVWEKPSDFDGSEEEIDKIKIENSKSNEGNIGKYEIVKEEESVFGKRKKSEDEEEEEKNKETSPSDNKSKNNNTKTKEEQKTKKEKKPLETNGKIKVEINLVNKK